jgi:hypothetical protein
VIFYKRIYFSEFYFTESEVLGRNEIWFVLLCSFCATCLALLVESNWLLLVMVLSEKLGTSFLLSFFHFTFQSLISLFSLLISYANNRFPEDYIPTVFDNYVVNLTAGQDTIELGLWYEIFSFVHFLLEYSKNHFPPSPLLQGILLVKKNMIVFVL